MISKISLSLLLTIACPALAMESSHMDIQGHSESLVNGGDVFIIFTDASKASGTVHAETATITAPAGTEAAIASAIVFDVRLLTINGLPYPTARPPQRPSISRPSQPHHATVRSLLAPPDERNLKG